LDPNESHLFDIEETHFGSTAYLSAVRYIRKMRGGSQAILVLCDDGHHYVIKMAGNLQGPNVLANELLGSVIANAVGLPVAPCRLIYLSDDFVDGEPGTWFETPTGRCRPVAGLHFGSLLKAN
jgi:hypothetical protein